MLDINLIRQHPGEIIAMLHNRQLGTEEEKLHRLLACDRQRKELVQRSDELKALRNRISKEIAALRKQHGDSFEEAMARLQSQYNSNEMQDELDGIQPRLNELETEMEIILLSLPNRLHPSVPVGINAADNIVHRGPFSFPHNLDFPLKNHLELGTALGIIDFERGAKVSGAGFPVYIGKGARLERALINFMLDKHTTRHGYTEVFPPFLVNQESLRGTGQWPKFADQVYHMPEDGLYAIPTAEVPLTNLHRGEMIDANKLPLCYTAYSACFRREAGSYGKDTRGFLRVHQFNKVEMVQFTRPEASYEALESIREHAESILEELQLPYRVLLLCSGDISANAAKCYDLEVWSPAEQKYLEVSSCSNFEDYQARRSGIRFKPDGRSKPEWVHTLNGSGLATSRLMVALLEHYQRPDGTIAIPAILQPYTGFAEIS